MRTLFSSWPFSVGGIVIDNILPGSDITLSIRNITLSKSISTALLTFSPGHEKGRERVLMFLIADLESSFFEYFTCISARFNIGHIVLFRQISCPSAVDYSQAI